MTPDSVIAWAMAALAVEPSQAVGLSDDEIVQVFAECHKGRIYPQDGKCGPRAMQITEGRAIIAAIHAKGSAS